MAFNTKLNLSNAKIYQVGGNPLTLSGDTAIAGVGTLKYTSDQSSTYTARSMVDAGYVTGKTSTLNIEINTLSGLTSNSICTASNGLTKTGRDVTLGGILASATIITDGRGTAKTGIEYGDDYSASFSNRSLVDKAYVTGQTSNLGGRVTVIEGQYLSGSTNGLTKTGLHDVKLGGNLTENTSITPVGATSIGLGTISNYVRAYTGCTVILNQTGSAVNGLNISESSVGSYSMDAAAGKFAYQTLCVTNGSICTSAVDSVALRSVSTCIAPNALTIVGCVDAFPGAQYASDYKANYTARSLVDKGYVGIVSGQTLTFINNCVSSCTITASNGLVKTGNNITLGGALCVNTEITGAHNLSLGSVASKLNEFKINTSGNATIITGDLLVTSSGATYTDAGSIKRGIQYAADYSTTFNDNSLVTKLYVDTVAVGLDPKSAVLVATTPADGNLSFLGAATIDTLIPITGSRVLVKDQTDARENGIYIVDDTGPWTRAVDFDGNPYGEITQGALVPVLGGSVNINSSWILITPDPITIDASNLNFGKFSQLLDVTNGAGICIGVVGQTKTICVELGTNSGLNTTSGLVIDSSIGGNGLTLINGILNVNARNCYCVDAIPVGYNDGECLVVACSDIVTAIGTPMYNLATPATKCVGGINIGNTLTGKTAFQLLQDILAPELFPTSLVNPNTSIFLTPSGIFEVGCSIASLCVVGTFNRGSISPQYCSASIFRSGCANAYCFTGAQMPAGLESCPGVSTVTNQIAYSVLSGSQTWGACSRYDCGVQPKGSSGTNYLSPLPSGCTIGVSASITGIYPYYYGKVTAGSRPTVTNALITTGCIAKPVVDSNGTVTVTFGSASQWTWLAIPQTSTSKTCWYVTPLDNGKINNVPSDKYPDECLLLITSQQGCWTDINYKVYVSGFAATDSSPIQFRNS